VLSEVEESAGRVAIIREGVVVDVDDVAELRRRAGQQVLLQFDETTDVAWLAHVPDLTDVVADGTSLHVRLHGEPDALLKAAARHHVVRWHAQDRELEDLFLDTYRGRSLSAGGGR
jgi:ABC-2 type transport system ATP-binding protein